MHGASPEIATLDEGRRNPRTHFFVAAVLCSQAGSIPVHIRNMSQDGALVESKDLPRGSTPVVLKRGSLQIAGRIAWSADRKAGIAFAAKVRVADWMARQPAAHQVRVDAIVSELRAATNRGETGGSPSEPPERSSVDAQLHELRAELAQLESTLVTDVILVATHPEIQMLDVSLQRIDRMIRQLRERHSPTARKL